MNDEELERQAINSLDESERRLTEITRLKRWLAEIRRANRNEYGWVADSAIEEMLDSSETPNKWPAT